MTTGRIIATADSRTELRQAESFIAGERETYVLVEKWIKQVTSLPIWHLTEDPEDVAAIVLLKLFSNLKAGKFRGDSTFRTYVQRITRYTCIDQVRSQRVKREIDPEELPRPEVELDPEQSHLKEEERQIFLKIFRAINPECQRLWRMIFSECLNYKEIGQTIGLPEGSVKRKVHECKKVAIELREKLV